MAMRSVQMTDEEYQEWLKTHPQGQGLGKTYANSGTGTVTAAQRVASQQQTGGGDGGTTADYSKIMKNAETVDTGTGIGFGADTVNSVGNTVTGVFQDVKMVYDQQRADREQAFSEKMRNRQQGLAEQTGLAGMKNARRGLGMQGMELLANQRTEAGKAARQRRFNTDLYAAMRGA